MQLYKQLYKTSFVCRVLASFLQKLKHSIWKKPIVAVVFNAYPDSPPKFRAYRISNQSGRTVHMFSVVQMCLEKLTVFL